MTGSIASKTQGGMSQIEHMNDGFSNHFVTKGYDANNEVIWTHLSATRQEADDLRIAVMVRWDWARKIRNAR